MTPIVGPLPFDILNGQIVDAVPVMADLQWIVDQVNANGPSSFVQNFIQSGAGAVTRTSQDKMRDFVSVKDFGAVGDGVADDTAAIQAALNAHLNVFAPGGSYKTTSLLAPRTGQTFWGAGMGATTITGTSSALIDWEPVALTTGNITISDMTLAGTAAVSSAIKFKNLSLVRVFRVEISGLTNGASKPIYFLGVLGYRIADCYIHTCGGDFIYLDTSGLSPSNNGHVSHNQFNADIAGVNSFVTATPGTEDLVIDSANDFEGNPIGCNIAMQVSGTIGCKIDGNYTEGISGASIAANAAGTVVKGLTIIGGHFATGSGAAADIVLNSTGPNDSVTIIGPYFALLGNVGGAPAGVEVGNTANYTLINPSAGSGGTAFLKKGGVTQPGNNFVVTSRTTTVNGFAYNPVDNSITYPDGHRWVSGNGLPNLPFQTNPNVNDRYTQTNGVSLAEAGTGVEFRCSVGGATPIWKATS